MNQVYSANYQSYQPSYNEYHSPSSGQWAGYGHSRGVSNTYDAKISEYDYSHNTYPHCMGQCNPPKLYAETFNYLTENLMKPVIEEVYQDLKSITAANAIANNPAASKILQAPTKPITQGNQNGQDLITTDANAMVMGTNDAAYRAISQSQNNGFRGQIAPSGYDQQKVASGRNGLT